ncbi:MAG: SGNH/GDSL hydrolase family protein [Planctomycetota bacterium]
MGDAGTAPRRRGAGPLGRALLAVGALVAALGVVEVALRVAGLPPNTPPFELLRGGADRFGTFAPDPTLFWRLRPNSPVFRVNHLGLRGHWPRGPDTSLTIACLGDSSTFGVATVYEETYGLILERTLQAQWPARRVECVLGALPGYSSHQDRALFDAHVTDLQPDVLVLYVGAWNDFMPAMHRSDRAWAERVATAPGRLRLARAWENAVDAWLGTDAKVYDRARRRGQRPDGARVGVADFAANVEAMLAGAQALGAHAIVVIPPVQRGVVERHPVALEYREILRERAAAVGADVVDAAQLFDEFDAEAPPDALLPATHTPSFRDWVHPSPRGHRLLGEALARVIESRLPASATPNTNAPRAPWSLHAVAPDRVAALTETDLVLHGTGFDAWTPRDRVWIGTRWADRVSVVSDQQLRVRVPEGLLPGTHRIEILSEHGPVALPDNAGLTVAAPTLEISVQRGGRGVRLRAQVMAPPGMNVLLWASPTQRPEPLTTRHGAFELAGLAEHPAGRADLPVQLPPPLVGDRVGPSGTATLEYHLKRVGPNLEELVLQALLAWSGAGKERRGGGLYSGVLTAPVRVSLR